MTATLLVGLALACLAGAIALTLAGVRCLLVRPVAVVPTPARAAARVPSEFSPAATGATVSVAIEGVGALVVEDGVLLNTLWEHLPNADCQSGECGGCKMRLLEGQVRWIREPEAVIDRTTHFLACSCEAVGHVKCATV
jgi:ferredoxin